MEDYSDQFSKLQVVIDSIQNWPEHELRVLYKAITLLASILGGREFFTNSLGELIIQRTDTGASLGLAYRGRIKFSAKSSISTWTVIHELAHTWMQKMTGNSQLHFQNIRVALQTKNCQ